MTHPTPIPRHTPHLEAALTRAAPHSHPNHHQQHQAIATCTSRQSLHRAPLRDADLRIAQKSRRGFSASQSMVEPADAHRGTRAAARARNMYCVVIAETYMRCSKCGLDPHFGQSDQFPLQTPHILCCSKCGLVLQKCGLVFSYSYLQ